MAHFRVILLMLILCALMLSACGTNDETQSSLKVLFMEDIDSIVTDIQVMYEETVARDIHWSILHIAFADIDFDDTPEFFYGYQTITGSHNKIWYRAYSLKNRAMINSEHSADWNTYLDDKECSFFTGPNSFMEGYYLNADGEPCFVTKTFAGAVTQVRTDYVFMEYTNSTLLVETGFECDKELLAIKQVWSPTDISNIENDIMELLNEYSD